MSDFVTRKEITDEWIAIRREAIERQGLAARPSETGNAIELKGADILKGPIDNIWRWIMLPRAQREFESAEVRDEVLKRLTE